MTTPTPEARQGAQNALKRLLSAAGMDADEADDLAEFAVDHAAEGKTSV